VKSHSESPRSPDTKCRALPKCTSGNRLNTPAKPSEPRRRSVP
jgi:hypothetical protein